MSELDSHALPTAGITSQRLLELLKEGVAAARSGDRSTARQRLLLAIREKPDYEVPWLWLARVTEGRDEAAWFVHRALTISPDHQKARAWLERLQGTVGRAPAWRCPFCGRSSRQRESQCPGCKTAFAAGEIESWCGSGADRALLRASLAYLASPVGQTCQPLWHWTMGIAHLNLGNFTSALPHVARASALNPDDQPGRELAAKLSRWLEQQGSGGAPAAAVALGTVRPPLVLVVDDSPTVRKILAVTLEAHGYRVQLAADGLQALAKLDELVPDLVFLDIAMPHLDGYRVCRFIKSNERTREVPVIMLSGKDGFFDKMRGRMAGADGHVAKPVDQATLLQVATQYGRLAIGARGS